jgi:tetrahydrodipicolinate N-succinyltransferase
MSGKLAAVEGCTLTLSSGAGVIQIITPASAKVRASGKGVYFGALQISVTGFSSEKVDVGAGTGVLNPTATKAKSGGYAVRAGDESEVITISGTKGNSSATDTVTVRITDAGQTKLKAE